MSKKFFITSLLICSIVATSCKKDSAETKTDTGQNINCFRVTQTDVVSNHSFPFITEPYRNTDLSFRVGGVIHQFDVHPGNYYRKGDVIASIDPRDYKVRLTRSEAIYKQAETEFKRIETLYKSNNVAASTYEKSRADYTSALTAYQSAQYELEDTKLVAPFNGYIQSVYIEQYQDVRATQPVISFIDIDKIKIETYVPQTVALRLSKGQQVATILDGAPNEKYQSIVSDVSKSTIKNNLSYILTATLDNSKHRLLAGMSGNLIFTPTDDLKKCQVIIPQISLRNKEKKGSYVWVINPNSKQAVMRFVTVGTLLKDGFVSIEKGLLVDELIATTGIDFLYDSCLINILDYEN